eukprot:c15138_g1_i1.p1 GENE.c15138_g1_i1~~c15138_g1_i1.p1  ORF type:complete len:431 (-),score=118.18 c15138_g1_i1:148-1440(-)
MSWNGARADDEITHLLSVIEQRDSDISNQKKLIARARDEIVKLQAELVTLKKGMFEFGPDARADAEAVQLQLQQAIDDEQRRRQEIGVQLRQTTEENTQLRLRLRETENQVVTNTQECAKFQENIDKLSQMASETQKVLLEREEALAEWVEYGKRMGERVKQLEHDLATTSATSRDMNQLRDEIIQLTNERNSLKDQAQQARGEADHIRGILESQRTSLNNTLQRLETCSKKLQSCEAERNRFVDRLADLERDLSEKTRKSTELSRKVEELTVQVETLEHTNEAQRVAFEKVSGELTAKGAEQQLKLQEYEAALNAHRDGMERVNGATSQLASQLRAKDDELTTLKQKLERRKQQLREVSEQVLRFQGMHQNTRKELATVVAERDAALKEIEALKTELVEVDQHLQQRAKGPGTAGVGSVLGPRTSLSAK